MNRLRSKIDSSCPVIFRGNWPTEAAKGWRHACNISLTDGTGEDMLADYQTAHGRINVTIGQPFDENAMKPSPEPKLCGLYVRDTEDLVRELQRDLDDNKKVAKWLAKA